MSKDTPHCGLFFSFSQYLIPHAKLYGGVKSCLNLVILLNTQSINSKGTGNTVQMDRIINLLWNKSIIYHKL